VAKTTPEYPIRVITKEEWEQSSGLELVGWLPGNAGVVVVPSRFDVVNTTPQEAEHQNEPVPTVEF
jgi:hypothetical protein